MAKKKNTETKIESIRHKDKRRNIPTKELRDFVAEDEAAPKTMLYPRDPSLDPQLVWKGKDDQDREDLAVPVVPIYIQEKIHPRAIISALPRKTQPGDSQLDLFADFNGGPEGFEQKIDFYRHDQNWSNRMILGDSLLVMTSLAEKEGLKGKVQTIYFDPPYGIKFGSNWQVSTRKRDVKDGKAEDATRQPEQVRAFRDTWKLGIHSYLAYLRDRLSAARDLLTETGSVFVQISEENLHLIRCVLDEVFGSENFLSQINYATTGGFDTLTLSRIGDHLIWYAKDKKHIKYRQLFDEKGSALDQQKSKYDQIELKDGNRRALARLDREKGIPAGARIYRLDNLFGQGAPDQSTPFEYKGVIYNPPKNNHWKPNYPDGLARIAIARRIQVTGKSLAYVRFLDDLSVQPINNTWTDISGTVQSRSEGKIFVVQTSTTLLQRCLLMTTDPGDLVLDPTCGSGTTAYVAEQWGRRWITCDTSRVALALARTRLMAAKYPYYLLADSPEGIKKEAELTGKFPPPHATESDIRKGFVYKRVPHVTLKSIANNPDIREGMTRKGIDEAISRHADTETLFDQPYEDSKTLRVTGPFTVESLSPHRVLATDAEKQDRQETADFAEMILENLRKAGIQNTRKNERLKFDTLDSFAGSWIHAAGTYTEKVSSSAKGQKPVEKVRRVAVSIGPEQGTVGPQQVKEAAKEAVQGIGYDLLIVCGFAFDPHVSEEVKRYGKLNVLPARMNPDLAMGDELLKKTGAGNLFMVFGEPDVDIKKDKKSGKLTVEIKGVDVYDPTTGQIRSSSTDDIACWFIDTDYNGESFFVRHAYFTGADEPYDKLKRALRAEIDEAAWSSLYSTTSTPFDPPETGKIAIKVINHYGDEVLKVFDV
ncbi:MAG: site-specific DNA-methyltransferase [Thermodesulfobacteriota bacterium]